MSWPYYRDRRTTGRYVAGLDTDTSSKKSSTPYSPYWNTLQVGYLNIAGKGGQIRIEHHTRVEAVRLKLVSITVYVMRYVAACHEHDTLLPTHDRHA